MENTVQDSLTKRKPVEALVYYQSSVSGWAFSLELQNINRHRLQMNATIAVTISISNIIDHLFNCQADFSDFR
jgi:hypothetical protein